MGYGGSRPGAGRPKTKVEKAVKTLRVSEPGCPEFKTALEFAMFVINDPNASIVDKTRLAVAAMPYQSAKSPEPHLGKKEQALVNAKDADTGTTFGELMAEVHGLKPGRDSVN